MKKMKFTYYSYKKCIDHSELEHNIELTNLVTLNLKLSSNTTN